MVRALPKDSRMGMLYSTYCSMSTLSVSLVVAIEVVLALVHCFGLSALLAYSLAALLLDKVARYFMMNLVVTVLQAPDSPLTSMLWL